MIYHFIVLINILNLSMASVEFDSSIRCECSELNMNDCQEASLPCAWSEGDNSCTKVDLSCSIMGDQNTCEGFINCRWKNNSCEQFDPECSDFTTAARCPSLLECYWNKSGKCYGFTKCSDYDVSQCPDDEFCEVKASTCVEYDWVECAKQTKSTCNGYSSKSDICAWRNDNTCASINYKSLYCSDLNQFTELCNLTQVCAHDGTECRIAKCSDKKSITTCLSTHPTNTEYVLCAWNNGSCSDAQDTSQLTSQNCYTRTSGNYKWSDNKCELCDHHFSLDGSSNQSLLVFGTLVLYFITA